jgi:L-ascorbate metabolism protein UlaG (beta-lactamase superfamily)
VTSPLRITWIGHATVLLELDGTRLLTDPVLRKRIAHLRSVQSPPTRDELGRIDTVLLSHAHRDHLDIRSLRRLGKDVPVLAARGAVPSLRRRGFRGEVDSIATGERRTIGQLSVQATPALHGRPGTAVGFLIRGSRTVYFAGDTDLFPELAGLANPLDVALLPIWGWGPSIGAGHLDPERAAEAVLRLRPKIVVPIHWGSLHPLGMSRAAFLREPAEAFQRLVRERAPKVEVRLLEPGESTFVLASDRQSWEGSA